MLLTDFSELIFSYYKCNFFYPKAILEKVLKFHLSIKYLL